MEQESIGLVNGPCWVCHDAFWYDPNRVVTVDVDPSVNLTPDKGGHPQLTVPQPMCPGCCAFANPWRKTFGLPLLSEADTAQGLMVS